MLYNNVTETKSYCVANWSDNKFTDFDSYLEMELFVSELIRNGKSGIVTEYTIKENKAIDWKKETKKQLYGFTANGKY